MSRLECDWMEFSGALLEASAWASAAAGTPRGVARDILAQGFSGGSWRSDSAGNRIFNNGSIALLARHHPPSGWWAVCRGHTHGEYEWRLVGYWSTEGVKHEPT